MYSAWFFSILDTNLACSYIHLIFAEVVAFSNACRSFAASTDCFSASSLCSRFFSIVLIIPNMIKSRAWKRGVVCGG